MYAGASAVSRCALRIIWLVLLALLATMPGVVSAAPLVNTMTIDGAIDPAIAQYVDRAVGIAEKNRADALVVKLKTPGGLDDSMRAIVEDFLASRVPIVVYVYPRGARAASAGAIITLAANIAAMSPGTNIGAAHPVSIGGEKPDKTMMTKVENDAAAFSRSIAKQRGRNIDWAEKVVRKSVSATEEEAKKLGVIDIIAVDMNDLLKQIDGRRFRTPSGVGTIDTTNARTQEIGPSVRERFLHVISNPNLAYIFMMIAVYGIIFELSNPGSIFPGVVGGIALLLALYSFAVIPINLTGVLLIVFAVALFVTDLFTPSHGILTAGGIVSFLVGSLILFESSLPVFRVSITLVIAMTAATAAFFLFAVGAGIRAQRARVVTGIEGMVGQFVEARTDIDPKGKVFAEGEHWNAITEGEPIRRGETVRIVGFRKLTLIVRKER